MFRCFRSALYGKKGHFCRIWERGLFVDSLALYRKYRPKTFSEVVGQASVTSSLAEQVRTGRISHAYLFTGTRGTGKTTCAKILARAICCQSPVDGSPCNQCPACRAILSGSAMDITEIDAASNNGVDNIRERRQEAMYAPTELSYRVYIIDEVHMLSQGAFNALLKTLEEPPKHVVFILATTELHKVPATILSRCQRYDFRRIPAEIMAGALEGIAQKEGFLLDHDAADILAAMGDGSMRDSISLLDRARGAAFHVTSQSVTDALGLASEKEIMDIFNAVMAGDAAGAVSAFTDCYMTGRDIVAIFDNMLSLLRDIYLYKATGTTDYLLSRWRLRVPELAGACPASRIESCIESINFFLGRTTRTSAKRLDGEMCLIKMSIPGFGVPSAAEPVTLPAFGGRPVETRPAPAAETRPQPRAAQAAPAPSPAPAVQKPADDDGPPPWDDVPPENPQPVHEIPPQNAPVRNEYEAKPAASGPSDGRYDKLRAGLEGKVNSAVRSYLKTAAVTEQDGGIIIEVPEEGLIFIGKPDVLAVIEEAGKAAGYSSVKVVKRQPRQKQDPLELIRSRAEKAGVKVNIK